MSNYPDNMDWKAYDRMYGDDPIETALDELPNYVWQARALYVIASRIGCGLEDAIYERLSETFAGEYVCGEDENGEGWERFMNEAPSFETAVAIFGKAQP